MARRPSDRGRRTSGRSRDEAVSVAPWDPGDQEIFVVAAPGLQDITLGEALPLLDRAQEVEVSPGGLTLRGNAADLLRLNAGLRTASRVLVRLARFRARTFGDLLKKAGPLPWAQVLPEGTDPAAVRFDVTARKSRLYHTGAIEERLREALAGALGVSGSAAAVPRSERPPGGNAPRTREAATGSEDPPPRFVVRLLRDEVTLSVDTSGEALHRRGYRGPAAKAPLRETLAAALLLAAEYDGRSSLVDPFCGAGTVVIEGALLAAGRLPNPGRRFAFESWPGLDAAEVAHARRGLGARGGQPQGAGPQGGETAEARARPFPTIMGSDRDAGAVAASRENARAAGVGELTSFSQAVVSEAPLPDAPGLLATNPPYGHRVGDPRSLRNLYARLGARLRAEWSGGRVVLLSADPALTHQLRLPTRTVFRTSNGGIRVEGVVADVP